MSTRPCQLNSYPINRSVVYKNTSTLTVSGIEAPNQHPCPTIAGLWFNNPGWSIWLQPNYLFFCHLSGKKELLRA